ncbi:hypothetical protein D3C81_1119690 [compost metagenome]
MSHRRRFLDLGHQVGAVTDQLACFDDVFRALHERQGHPVHTQFQAEGQVAAILGGQRAEVQHCLWNVDAFAVGQLAAIEYFSLDGVAVLGSHPQAQLAVIEQQVHAWLKRSNDFRVGQVDPLDSAGGTVQVQAQGLAALQLDFALGKTANPQFRPLQVHEDTQRVIQLAFNFADPLVAQGVVFVFAMAEVEAEDIYPGLNQLADVIDTLDGRAEGSEDFDFFVRRHVWHSRGSEWRENR